MKKSKKILAKWIRKYNSDQRDGHDVATTNRSYKQLVDFGVVDGLCVDRYAYQLLDREHGEGYAEEVAMWRAKFYADERKRPSNGDDRQQRRGSDRDAKPNDESIKKPKKPKKRSGK